MDSEAEEIARLKRELQQQEEHLKLEDANRKRAEEEARRKAEIHLKQTEEEQRNEL